MYKGYGLRWGFFIVGLLVLAFGITLTIKGKGLGIGPWDVFHYGLFLQLGLTIGTWSIIVGFILIATTALVTKSIPKIGAFLNMLLIGLFIDMFNLILPDVNTLFSQLFVLIIGTIIIGYGIGLYVSAGLGAGPRDSVMLLVTEKTGWKIQHVRNAMEVIVLICGWILGGPVGLGTIIVALGTGPIVGVSLPQCQRFLQHVLGKNEQKKSSLAG